jgi:hypothetical protein
MVPIWHPEVTCVPSDKTYGYDSDAPKSAAVATETSIRESVSKAVGEIPIIAPRSHLVL